MAKEFKKVISDKKSEANKLMNDDQVKKCNIAIHTASVASGVAGAIPVPVADAIPITAVQVSMVFVLGKIFNQKISESAAKGLISAAASTFIGRNLVKLIPLVGWGVSAVVAAGVTEAIGWTIAVDLAKNATKAWEKDHRKTEGSLDSEEPDAEINKKDEIIKGLEVRGKVFLSGEKTPNGNKTEYTALILDFEKVLDYLEENDPLREMYDELSLLGI